MSTEDIKDRTLKYLEAMKACAAEGGDIADYIDTAAMDAMRRITGSLPGMTGGIVPSITETDSNGVTRGYDLFSRLMKERIVILAGQVDATMASIACASLIYLDSAASGKKEETVKVVIDSPGGSVLAGLAIYDAMRIMNAPIETTGIGMQASMGSILLASGDTRRMTANSKLMIHQISGGTEGKASVQEVGMAFTEQLHEDLKNIYVRHIGLTHEFFDLALEHDTWLTPEQALKIGFIHEIIPVPEGKRTAYEDECKRPAGRPGLAAELNRVATRYIENMSAPEIVASLNSVSSEGGIYGAYRGNLVTRLSQFPQFWTKAKQAEMGVNAQPAVANQNTPAVTSKRTTAKVTPNA